MPSLSRVMRMDGESKRFVRFRSDFDSPPNSFTSGADGLHHSQPFISGSAFRRPWEKGSWSRIGQTLKFKTSFSWRPSEDDPSDAASKKKKGASKWSWDPASRSLHRWNLFFVASCLVAVSVDPLFYYLAVVNNDQGCIQVESRLKTSVTVFRTLTDFCYVIHMLLQFRTAYVAPSSRVFGKGELVTDPKMIAARYLKKNFWLDLIAVLPVPQFVIWVVIPSMNLSTPSLDTKKALRFIVFFQYLPRLFRLLPLTSKIVNTTGVLLETAWAGAAFNLVLYMLASHVVGACWYMLAVEREQKCWLRVCRAESASLGCTRSFLDCASLGNAARATWWNSSAIGGTAMSCNSTNFSYGIYGNAIDNSIASLPFVTRYLYSLWLGLLALSSLTQTLNVSSYEWEIIFDIIIIIAGLLLFAFLIGNMQTYLQSLTLRLEEMRVKRRDSEQWMRHRNLPDDIVDRIRRYDEYKWVATRGVDEEDLVQSLPSDLRRDIKRHLCLNLVRNVPFFDEMDDSLLDAMCERLKPALCPAGTVLLREGAPVSEMLFIIRGALESRSHGGGTAGKQLDNDTNIGLLKSGDFCGEELLTWALDPKPQRHLPISARTVAAVMEVEAFSLAAEDLKFVASQFRRLHSKHLQHTFRYYSHHWRTWAASFIQAAWRRHQQRRLAELRRSQEDLLHPLHESRTADDEEQPLLLLQQQQQQTRGEAHERPISPRGALGKFTNNGLRGLQRLRSLQSTDLSRISSISPKPAEPDFSRDA